MSFWTETSVDALGQQYRALLIVTQFFSGLCTWDLIQSLYFDISFWRGKHAHARLIFVLYAGCRYISFVSIICKAAHVCTAKFHNYQALLYIYHVTYYISLAFAYEIFAIRVIAMCKRDVVTYCVSFFQLGLYINTFIAVSHVGHHWQREVFRTFFWIYLASVSTIFLGLAFFSFLLAYRRPTSPFEHCESECDTDSRKRLIDLFNQLLGEAVFDMVVVWISRTTAAIIRIIAIDPTANLRRTIDYTTFVLNIVCACHTFKKLARQGDAYPICLMYLAKILQAKRDRRLSATSQPESMSGSHSIAFSPRPSASGNKSHGEVELDVFVDHVATATTTTPSAPSCSTAVKPPVL